MSDTSGTQTRIEITGNIIVHHPVKPQAVTK